MGSGGEECTHDGLGIDGSDIANERFGKFIDHKIMLLFASWVSLGGLIKNLVP